MVGLVFTIGILNLALGYLAAVALAEPPPWAGWRLRATVPQRRRPPKPPAAATPESDTEREPPPASDARPLEPIAPAAPAADVQELPPSWLDMLSSAGIIARSFVEGTAEVLRLEVGRYREQLVMMENRARSLLAASDAAAIRLLADDLRFINQDWSDKQTDAAEMLARRAGRLGDHEDSAHRLEQLLLDQAAEIQASCTVLGGLDARTEAETGGKLLLEQLATLIDHAHALRDRMQDALATLLCEGQRLATLDPRVQTDQLTQLPNRIGLESVLAVWWREDPKRGRPLSLVWIDIDRFGRINERLGTRGGDRTLAALARLIEEFTRRDRGYDRLARAGGQAFCFVLGDTLATQALTMAERLRQTIEATTFSEQGTEFELTLSCGVISAERAETAPALLRRAAETARFAKKAGRNRCAIDDGKGPATHPPPQFPVKGRLVSVGQE